MFKSLHGRDFQFDPASGAILVGGRPALSGVPRARGKDFYVSSLVGASGSDGRGPFSAISTIDTAIGKCTAGAGDRIIVMPGHVETVIAAAGVALDVADVEIIGLGRGAKRPQINFTTAVGASFKVTAANCQVSNLLFTGGVDALTNPVHIDAADFRMFDCETRDVTGQATDFIVTTDNADRLIISGWKHLGAAAAGADTAISLVGGDDWVIENFDIYGNFAVAAIENVTTAANRIRIGGGDRPCYIWTENAADIAITLHASTTGHIGPNINIMLQDNAANITEAIVMAAAQLFQPVNLVNLVGESSMQTNITASTDA
jgi:hypothetical protein